MNSELLQKTYELIDEIKSLKQYKRLKELSLIINQNQEIRTMIETFNKYKLKYEEASKYGSHHPDLKQIQINLKDAKEILYNNDIIKEYKDCEKQIQSILNNVSKEIAQTVSNKIKHPNEFGLVNKH